ncbi:Rv3235 family protein [Pseudonocardia sp. T1-2H]|uniref:Rv3235 family protein n=1 Tax=Pseudonocardia sp. T1-2H TaxID=3128899 RepID=UPI003100EB6D
MTTVLTAPADTAPTDTTTGRAAPTTAPAVPEQRCATRPRLRRVRYEPEPEDVVPPRTGRGTAWPGAAPAPPPPSTFAAAAERRATERELAARRRAGTTMRLVVEVVDGRRPVRQLHGLVGPRVLRYVTAAILAPHARRATARLTSVHVSLPARDCAEVTAVCSMGGRVRAIAARFELGGPLPGEWTCTALRVL